MQTMPTLLWNKRGVLVSHRGSFIFDNFWSSVVAAFVSNAEREALGTSATTTNFPRRPFAPWANVPCNIPRRPERHENPDSGRLSRSRRRQRSGAEFRLGCAIGLQNACALLKHPDGA